MPINHRMRQPQFLADRPYLVLEQFAQRFEQFQFHMLGQSADVVMALDIVGFAGLGAGRFDDVGIDGPLGKPGGIVDFSRFFLEISTNRLPMILRFRSGSSTPANADKKRSSALTRMTLTPMFWAKVRMT